MAAVLATLFTVASDLVITIQFYREYFAMKRVADEHI